MNIELNMSAVTALIKIVDLMKNNFDLDVINASRTLQMSSMDSNQLDYKNAEMMFRFVDNVSEKESDIEFVRSVLKRAIKECNFQWKNSIKFGRDYVLQALSQNEIQVFEFANLLDSNPDIKLLNWWDDLADVKSTENFDFRIWELKSFEMETERLITENCPFRPKLISVNDNMQGFDILSFIKIADEWQNLFIEVKSSSLSQISFYLSKRESERLLMNPSRFNLHYWGTSDGYFRNFKGEHLSQYIPGSTPISRPDVIYFDFGRDWQF